MSRTTLEQMADPWHIPAQIKAWPSIDKTHNSNAACSFSIEKLRQNEVIDKISIRWADLHMRASEQCPSRASYYLKKTVKSETGAISITPEYTAIAT